MDTEFKQRFLKELQALVRMASECDCEDVVDCEDCDMCGINGGDLVDAVCSEIAELKK